MVRVLGMLGGTMCVTGQNPATAAGVPGGENSLLKPVYNVYRRGTTK